MYINLIKIDLDKHVENLSRDKLLQIVELKILNLVNCAIS